MKTRTFAAFVFLFASILSAKTKAQTLADAIKFTDNEQFEKAASAFKKIIAGDLNNGDNYFWYGENYFKTEDLDSALIMYEAGLKKNPSNALCMVGKGKILWLQGKNDDAKKMFFSAGVVLSDKSNKMTPQQKAMVCLKIAETYISSPNKDLNEAMNQINKAATFDQKNMLVKIYMGDALYEKNPGNSSDAIAEYKKAIDLDKNSPIPLFKKGILYLQCKNGDAAQSELDNALKIDSMFAPAWRVKGETYYFQNKLDMAISSYQRYIRINKGNITARVRYASFLFVAKKYPDCITECKKLQQEGCTKNLLNRLLGFAYYETGDCKTGLEAMDKYFEKQSDANIIELDYEYYARLKQKCGLDSVAVIYYRKALIKDSTKTDMWTEIGNIYKKKKNYPEAIKAYKMKVDKGGKNLNVNDHFFLGQSYYYNSQFGKADTAFIKYCEIQKEIYYGFFWRGRANAQLDPENKTWQAHTYYETAILKSRPEDSKKDMEEAYFYMGLYYLKSMKDYPSAKCCFQKVVEFKLNADKKDSNYTLAKNTLDLPEMKNATVAPNCIKQ